MKNLGENWLAKCSASYAQNIHRSADESEYRSAAERYLLASEYLNAFQERLPKLIERAALNHRDYVFTEISEVTIDTPAFDEFRVWLAAQGLDMQFRPVDAIQGAQPGLCETLGGMTYRTIFVEIRPSLDVMGSQKCSQQNSTSYQISKASKL